MCQSILLSFFDTWALKTATNNNNNKTHEKTFSNMKRFINMAFMQTQSQSDFRSWNTPHRAVGTVTVALV